MITQVIDEFSALVTDEAQILKALEQVVHYLRAGQSIEQACSLAARSTTVSISKLTSFARLIWLAAERHVATELPTKDSTSMHKVSVDSLGGDSELSPGYMVGRTHAELDAYEYLSPASDNPRQQWTLDRSAARIWLHREDAERVGERLPGSVFIRPFDPKDIRDLRYYVTGTDSDGLQVFYVGDRWLRNPGGGSFVSKRLAEAKAAEVRLNPPIIRRKRKIVNVNPATIQVEDSSLSSTWHYDG